MSYRLTDVTDLPRSPATLLTMVHPMSAVEIVGHTLNPYTTNRDAIENLDPRQHRDELLEQLATGERLLFDASGASPGNSAAQCSTPCSAPDDSTIFAAIAS